MRSSHPSATRAAVAALLASGCITGEDAFIGGRLPTLCSNSYATCNVTAGCELDSDHYVRGSFPGTRRVIVTSPLPRESEYQLRLYLSRMDSPGTELLAQMYEPDCSLNPNKARVHLTDVDLFEEAGNDRTLILDSMFVERKGEHLLEVFSDASIEYIMVVEPLDLGF